MASKIGVGHRDCRDCRLADTVGPVARSSLSCSRLMTCLYSRFWLRILSCFNRFLYLFFDCFGLFKSFVLPSIVSLFDIEVPLKFLVHFLGLPTAAQSHFR